jgi:hypothetical protein
MARERQGFRVRGSGFREDRDVAGGAFVAATEP